MVRSIGKYFVFFLGIPNEALNQALLNPINPRTLAINIKTKQIVGENSSKPLNI